MARIHSFVVQLCKEQEPALWFASLAIGKGGTAWLVRCAWPAKFPSTTRIHGGRSYACRATAGAAGPAPPSLSSLSLSLRSPGPALPAGLFIIRSYYSSGTLCLSVMSVLCVCAFLCVLSALSKLCSSYFMCSVFLPATSCCCSLTAANVNPRTNTHSQVHSGEGPVVRRPKWTRMRMATFGPSP